MAEETAGAMAGEMVEAEETAVGARVEALLELPYKWLRRKAMGVTVVATVVATGVGEMAGAMAAVVRVEGMEAEVRVEGMEAEVTEGAKGGDRRTRMRSVSPRVQRRSRTWETFLEGSTRHRTWLRPLAVG